MDNFVSLALSTYLNAAEGLLKALEGLPSAATLAHSIMVAEELLFELGSQRLRIQGGRLWPSVVVMSLCPGVRLRGYSLRGLLFGLRTPTSIPLG